MDKLALNKPAQLMVQLKGMNTPAKCAFSQTPALAIVKKEKGEKSVLTIIQILISDCNDFLNVARKMSAEQISQTANMILSDFYYMNIADINLVFTRAKKGYYGELYQSLDGMKIYQWFEKYSNERAQTIYDDRLKDHDIIKSKE